MTARPRPWSEFRAALEAAGVRPSRRLGQNFLVDANLAEAIARDADPQPGETVLEVGPGGGFLTQHLLLAGARVVAVEIDARLAAVTRDLAPEPERLEVLNVDVLAGKHALAPEVLARLPVDEPWQLAANLPYSVASPLLVLLARLPNPPRAMTALVQAEVADRILAPPGGRDRGPLGLRLAVTHAGRRLRTVAPRLFWPPPKVESAVIRLELRADRPPPAELAAFDAVVEVLFRHRRQTLERRLREAWGDATLARRRIAELGLDPRGRPEGLALEDLLALARGPGPSGPRPDPAPDAGGSRATESGA